MGRRGERWRRDVQDRFQDKPVRHVLRRQRNVCSTMALFTWTMVRKLSLSCDMHFWTKRDTKTCGERFYGTGRILEDYMMRTLMLSVRKLVDWSARGYSHMSYWLHLWGRTTYWAYLSRPSKTVRRMENSLKMVIIREIRCKTYIRPKRLGQGKRSETGVYTFIYKK